MTRLQIPVSKILKIVRSYISTSAHNLHVIIPSIVGVVLITGALVYPKLTDHKQLTKSNTPVVIKPKPIVKSKKVIKPVVKPSPPPPPPPPKTSPAPVSRPVYTPPPPPPPVVKPSPSSSVSNLTPVPSTTSSSTTSNTSSSSSSSPSSGSQLSPVSGGYQSSNWSGYMSANGKYTSVSATWIADNPKGNGTTTTADATWVGIGGITTSDLIQVGTNNTVSSSGQVVVQAFYEMLPNVSTNIPSLTINPGDTINASVTEDGTNVWVIDISDMTSNTSFTKTVSYTSSNSSAEWIEEDPSYSNGSLVPFDNFGQVDFTNSKTIDNGVTDNLTQVSAQSITMVNSSGQAEATPSVIASDGTDFNIYYGTGP